MAGLLSQGLLLVATSLALAVAQEKAEAPTFLRDLAWWKIMRPNETKMNEKAENLEDMPLRNITERLTYLLPFIENADTDKDGKISTDDIWALQQRLDLRDAKWAIHKYDKNNDGKWNYKEFDAYWKKDMRKIWREEYSGQKIPIYRSSWGIDTFFSVYDKNDDTWLSEEEIIPLLNPSLTGSPMQHRRLWLTKTPPNGTLGHGLLKWEIEHAVAIEHMCPSVKAESDKELTKLMDPDDDGYFSLEDFIKCREDVKKDQLATLWKALDQDGDSKISKEELNVDVSKAHVGMYAYDWILALAHHSKLKRHPKHTEL